MFSPFASRDYRVLWLAIFLRSAALWLDQVARPVLVYELTGSAVLLGTVLAARMAPNLVLGLFAGAIVDRHPRRSILVLSQAGNVAAAGALFVLLLFDLAEAWHVIALAAAAGVNIAFFQPARQAILPSMVPAASLRPAVALSQTANTVMRIGGALLAGVLLAIADFVWIYGAMTAIYVGAVVCSAMIRTRGEAGAAAGRAGGSLVRQTLGGVRWAFETRWPLAVLAISVVMFIFLVPYQSVFVPLMVIDVLGEPRSWVGYLIAVGGAGAAAGSLLLAGWRTIPAPGRLMAVLLIAAGVVLAGMSGAPHLVVVAICVFVAAACSTNVMSLANLTLLAQTTEGMAGRALSLMNIARGMILVGALVTGGLADLLGARAGLLTMGVCLVICAVLMLATPLARRVGE
ncbi:MAG: MFS transporter [Chloroflexi bacterium]|nr:MFS transporter [Chloroflexota bacterium]MYI04774.1 MFS transporter [Chloroflexota bacterium]